MIVFYFTKTEIKEYLESINYKKCKTKEILSFYNNKELNSYYRSPKSYQQIRTIMNFLKKYGALSTRETNINIISRLGECLGRNLTTDNYIKLMDKINTGKYKNDIEIFNYIRKLRFKNRLKRFYIKKDPECIGPNIVAENVSWLLRFQKLPKKITYLDYGFGSGSKTMGMKKKFNIPIQNIYGLEVEEVFDGQEESRSQIEFSYEVIKGKNPFNYRDGMFNLVTSFVALHHVVDLDFTLRELNRIMQKNALFVVQEHDCVDIVDKMLADLEHTWWRLNNAIIKNTKMDYNTLDNNSYYSWFEWDIIMKNYGFEKIHYISHELGQKEKITPTRIYYFLYRKIRNL